MSAVVQRRRSRQTGTTVEIIDNRDGHFDSDDPNPWFCLCVEHGGVVSHETRHLAEAFAPVPREWCPTCQEEPEEIEHEIRTISSSRVGPTYQGAGGRTIFYGYCSCGAGTTNSASPESARRKLLAHARGDDRGIFKQ